MALVEFERGLEANMPDGLVEDGHIYISTDNGNMYLGKQDGNSSVLLPINRNPYYAICNTDSQTSAKIATITDSEQFILKEGALVNVRFSYSNSAESPTLNVNGSGNISIKLYDTIDIGSTDESSWHDNEVAAFVYDGTYWKFIGGISNVQSDWLASTGLAEVLNKPSIRTGLGNRSIVESATSSNESLGPYSHSEGRQTLAYSNSSHAEGIGDQLFVTLTSDSSEGSTDKDYIYRGSNIPVVGNVILYNNIYALVTSVGEGRKIKLSDTIGTLNLTNVRLLTNVSRGVGSHTEGYYTITSNEGEHAEGEFNISHQGSTNAENTISSIGIGTANHLRKNAIEVMRNGNVYIDQIGGYNTQVEPSTLQDVIGGIQSDIQVISETQSDWEEDDDTSSSYIQNKPSIKAGIGNDSIEEGSLSSNYALGRYSHAEGLDRIARGDYSHAEGDGETLRTTISGSDTTYTSPDMKSLKVGDLIVYGSLSAQITGFGKNNFSVDSSLGALMNAYVDVYVDGAIGADSHVEGWGTVAINKAEHAEGKFNVSHNEGNNLTISSIGIGTDNSNRINAIEVLDTGAVFIKSIGGYEGTSLFKASSIQDVIDVIYATLNVKAPIDSPTLTGIPKAPTASIGTNTTQIATTAFVQSAIGSITPPTSYYWANQQLTSTATYNASPEFQQVVINGDSTAASASTDHCSMTYDNTNKCLKFVFN